MATARRTFVVHVYAEGRCTVEDVRTGDSVRLDALTALSGCIAELMDVPGTSAPVVSRVPPSGID